MAASVAGNANIAKYAKDSDGAILDLDNTQTLVFEPDTLDYRSLSVVFKNIRQIAREVGALNLRIKFLYRTSAGHRALIPKFDTGEITNTMGGDMIVDITYFGGLPKEQVVLRSM